MRQRVQSRILAKPPPIRPEIRGELIEGYREDILKLQDLVGRDLSVWLEDEDGGRLRYGGTGESPPLRSGRAHY
jgi:hypothetical protein